MTERITALRAEDLDEVMQIENEAFSLPWERKAFLQELTQNACARYLCLRVDDRICAYGGMWLSYDGEAHVTNIAVKSSRRREGYGEKLLWALMQRAADCGMLWMSLECRRSNIAAQRLYHKVGFIDVGYRKRYYTDNNEDALVMCRLSLPHPHPENDPDLLAE